MLLDAAATESMCASSIVFASVVYAAAGGVNVAVCRAVFGDPDLIDDADVRLYGLAFDTPLAVIATIARG
jgi:hypothetical protein